MNLKKGVQIALLIILGLLVLVYLIRLISPRELDDLHPDIPCDPALIIKSDTLWVIPLYNNHSIASQAAWCSSLTAFNKSLQLHGVYHTYQEFAHPYLSPTYLQAGLDAFTACLTITPTEFKAPNLAFTSDNKPLLQQFNLTRKSRFNQIVHKVYHCNDAGLFSNKFIDWF